MSISVSFRCGNIRRTLFTGILALSILIASPVPLTAAEESSLSIQRHAPFNLFNTGEGVRFTVQSTGALPKHAEALAILRDEQGREVTRRTLYEVAREFVVDLGTPGRGYYDLTVTVRAGGRDPADGLVSIDGLDEAEDETTIVLSARCSLGVMDFVDRTAKEVREGGYVFGLKWWGGIRRQAELEDAMVKLGLQWTRIIQNEGGSGGGNKLTIQEMLTDYPMNAVIKVERYPGELYDAQRYGPMAEWEAKFGRGHWVIKTLPQKEPYQKWLQEQMKNIPLEQNIFEIWNEPWDKMGPEEFAELSQWIAEAILAVRPDAIIGPNLTGLTGEYEYDARVIAAGGMKHMKMVALHPYANPERQLWLLDYKAWLQEKLGREMDIHITEYGSHSTPEGPHRQSDLQMARNVARRSITIYSTGVKSLIPHTAGSSERNPTYWDDWMGFVRKNEEPKPVLLAHANVARMIDGSRYLGDLWFGPEVAAFVFDRRGEQVLVLWTIDSAATAKQENASRKDIDIATTAGQVVLTDLMGRETVLKAKNGKITLTLDEAPIFVRGLDASVFAQVSKDVRADRWPKSANRQKNERTIRKLSATPTWDGMFDEWKSATEVVLWNPSVNGKDASGVSYLAWDEQHLYVGLKVRDNEVYNPHTRNKLYRGDSLELFVSTEPRDSGGGFGPKDHQFILTPTSPDGSPVIAEMTERENGILEDITGAKYHAGPHGEGWVIELGIPWSQFGDFQPKAGARLSLDMRLNDEDVAHKRWKLDPADAPDFRVSDPSTWSLLILED